MTLSYKMKKLYPKESDDAMAPLDFGNYPMNQTIANDAKLMPIYIYLPFYKIFRIKINNDSSLSLLDSVFTSESIYIYNGRVLDKDQSFIKYNIAPESAIVSLSPKIIQKYKNITEKWIKITSNNEIFNQKIKMNASKENQKEIARIRDIKSMRNEMKHKQFGHSKLNSYKLPSNLKSLNFSINDKNEEITLITDYPEQEDPSCEPLPIIW